MGVGGNVAHACNIGYGLTGIPLLSLGSMLATVSMAVGVVATWRLLLRMSPAIRGQEHRFARDPNPSATGQNRCGLAGLALSLDSAEPEMWISAQRAASTSATD